MKISALLLLAGLATTPFLVSQEEQGAQDAQKEKKQEETKKGHPITAFPKEEAERMTREIDGSWALTGYDDPSAPELEDALDGFATFHEGFLTLLMQLHGARRRILGWQEVMTVQAGSYRYRFDEKGDMQTAVLMGFSNQNEENDLLPVSVGEAHEYLVQIADGILELRTEDQVKLTFRKVDVGEFPEDAIRRLEKKRGAGPAWDPAGLRDR
jgi:hypothetical protein